MTAAEGIFLLDIPDKNGNTQREVIEGQLERLHPLLEHQRAEKEALLYPPLPPYSMTYLLEWFIDLNSDRQSSGFGPMSISSGMILDWARLTGRRLLPSEGRALRALNRAWMSAWSQINATDEEK